MNTVEKEIVIPRGEIEKYTCIYCGCKEVPIDTEICPICGLKPIPPFIEEKIKWNLEKD